MDTITIKNVQVFTIEVKDFTIIVNDGRMKGSRLKYHAPGLEIYIIGKVPVYKRDKVNYHAFEIARALHIRLVNLVAMGWA